MSLQLKTLFFSSFAISVLIGSFIIFQEYKATNTRLHQTISTLDMVNHAGHEIVIEILLNLKDYRSLNKHLEQIPLITNQFQKISLNAEKPVELVEMEMSFVRVKKVVENLTHGQMIQKPVLEQMRNEIQKINNNVERLKKLSEQEINRLQARSETMILILYSTLVLYILSMFILLFQVVIKPILMISDQIEQVGHGELDKVAIPRKNDEIGRLAKTFNQMNDKRKQTEEALKLEITEHKKTLDEVKVLSGFLPICASCKNIRDDQGYWNQIESYIKEHTDAEFSHSICPDCAKKLYPDYITGDSAQPVTEDK